MRIGGFSGIGTIRAAIGLAAMSSVLFAVPAHAEWWMVYAEGQKPNRTIVYLDLQMLERRDDPARIMTIDVSKKIDDEDLVDHRRIDSRQMFESENSPAFIASTYKVKCREQLVGQTFTQARWRNGTTEDMPGRAYMAADTSPIYHQVWKFVCDKTARQKSEDMFLATTDATVHDVTWQVFWQDGTEPQYTSGKSVAEQKAEIDASLKKAREAVDSAIGAASTKLGEIANEREKTISEQKARFSRMRGKAWPLLESWIGRSEADLALSWGQPQDSYNADGRRFIHYSYGIERGVSDEYGNEYVQETFSCEMTFEIKGGKVADYRTGGNYCETAAASLPPGR
jgi:hypothetical protein